VGSNPTSSAVQRQFLALTVRSSRRPSGAPSLTHPSEHSGALPWRPCGARSDRSEAASGSCACRAGRDPLTARYGQASRTFRGSKSEAETALARFVTEVDAGAVVPTAQTLLSLLEPWIEHLEAFGRTQKTIDGYRSLVRARIGPTLGHVGLRKLSPSSPRPLLLRPAHRRLSPTYVRLCHAALSATLRQAVKWGWIDRSPAERATPPSVSVERYRTPQCR
jgi:integrase